MHSSQLRPVFLVQAMAQNAAEASAQARRGPELGELPTEPSRHGVFAWLAEGPRRGAVCHLAYNKNASEIRWAVGLVAALCGECVGNVWGLPGLGGSPTPGGAQGEQGQPRGIPPQPEG